MATDPEIMQIRCATRGRLTDVLMTTSSIDGSRTVDFSLDDDPHFVDQLIQKLSAYKNAGRRRALVDKVNEAKAATEKAKLHQKRAQQALDALDRGIA
jgi:hypothetical protein